MTIKVEVTIVNDVDVERKLDLPGKYVVCDRCEGEGRILNPSIGEHAYSQEEFAREFTDEEADEYFKGGHGIYGVECPECRGKRVVGVVDRDKMVDRSRRRLGRVVVGKSRARILKRLDDAVRARRQWERDSAMERRYGG